MNFRNRSRIILPSAAFTLHFKGAGGFCYQDGVSQSYLPAIKHGRKEVGAEVLLSISREFDRSLE